MDCLSFFMECLSSLLLQDTHLHRIYLSINIISRPKKHIQYHDWHVISKIKLVIVVAYNSYISCWIVCPSLWNVCLHYFFQIYICKWYSFPSISFLGQNNTYILKIDKLFQKKLMIVIAYYSWISWWIFCHSLWNVCLHYFFHIHLYISSLDIFIHQYHYRQKNTYNLMLDMLLQK